MPFKSARATRSSRPTGLADGLELESTPTRIGESAPRHPKLRMHWFPRSRTGWHGIRLHKRYYRMAAATPASRARKRRWRHHLGHAPVRVMPVDEQAIEPAIFAWSLLE